MALFVCPVWFFLQARGKEARCSSLSIVGSLAPCESRVLFSIYSLSSRLSSLDFEVYAGFS